MVAALHNRHNPNTEPQDRGPARASASLEEVLDALRRQIAWLIEQDDKAADVESLATAYAALSGTQTAS